MMQSTTGEGEQYYEWNGLQTTPEKIPNALQHVDQWVLWRAEDKPSGKGKNKIPYQSNGNKASSTNSETWTDFGTALGAFEESDSYSGIGFVVTDRDDFIGGDLDHCRDPATGKLTDLAQRIVDGINTYWEVSPSGTGIRFIGIGGSGLRSFKGNGIEIYTSGRYLTITGHALNASEPATISPAHIERLRTIAGQKKPQVAQEARVPQEANDDPVVKALKVNGLYQRRLDNGRHLVTCPKWHEHTGDDLSGTVYMEGNYNGHAEPRFVCQHTHGDEFRLEELKEYLGLVDQAPPVDPDDGPIDWIDQFVPEKSVMDAFADPKWIYENLAIEGHVVAIVAPPNGGKTTVMLQVAADMARDGCEVVYINADVSGGDAKSMREFADQHGFRLATPDLQPGKSMDGVVAGLVNMAKGGDDLSNTVFIFDTLKKMVDVINKSKAKELYKTFRSLSGQGMTSILLGHTNKYKGDDGRHIFEGTGDLRADVDELIYLEPSNDDATKTMTVSTRPDKIRGAFEPITFKIDADRRVTRIGYIDVGEEKKRRKSYAKDKGAIECILEILQGGQAIVQNDIIKAMTKDYGINHKVTRRVLSAYCDDDGYRQHWEKIVGFANNAVKFKRIKSRVISEDFTSVEGDNP